MDVAHLILGTAGAYVATRFGVDLVRERRARAARAKARDHGAQEPSTLQPWVDPERCVCAGLCIRACPEDDILRIIDGRAQVVNASACVGHSRCVTACPVQAVELIFGGDGRGVEIPRLGQDFETNVPGIYVAGELGGMGLIANAATQGAAAAAAALAAARGAGAGGEDEVDVVIVGAGPAGLAAAMQLQLEGGRYVLLERQDWGGAIRNYPRHNLILTRPLAFPGYGVVSSRQLLKEELVDMLTKIIAETGVTVSEHEPMEEVVADGGGFRVRTSRRTLRARRVILAVGRRGSPRKLGVPGEDEPRVRYELHDPGAWSDQDVVVVGGGDSAVQSALALAEQGNRVTLSYRRASFTRPRPANQKRIAEAIEAGRIRAVLSSRVVEVGAGDVHLIGPEGELRVDADAVFVMIGGTLPTALLSRMGIEVEHHFGREVRFF